jgi:hypothetical protein
VINIIGINDASPPPWPPPAIKIIPFILVIGC